jgi:uroporphyrin-III C-methyltransferase/precorrin-2 dehydrogenase/sirohydrochlorin ferrochelatase
MRYLPIFIDLRARPSLVVGAGEVAARKVELLLRSGAQVRVVAPDVGRSVRALARSKRLKLSRRRFRLGDLRGVHLVIAATNDAAVNAKVAAAARARALPVNVVDAPALCSFIMPSVLDREPVLVAVSTEGASPSLARLVRGLLEVALPPRLGELARFAARHRARIHQRFPDPSERRLFWESVLDGEIGALVLAGRPKQAAQALARGLRSPPHRARGRIALIGLGDGSPERLTLGAARWLGRAEAVLHDPSVPAEVLELCRRDAERRALGGRHPWSRDRVLGELLRLARSGRVVCLLRLGDPFASEQSPEVRALRAEGLRFERLRSALS